MRKTQSPKISIEYNIQKDPLQKKVEASENYNLNMKPSTYKFSWIEKIFKQSNNFFIELSIKIVSRNINLLSQYKYPNKQTVIID